MSFIANTAFQFRMTNNRYNDLQNIAGRYGSLSGTVFTGADCSAGLVCEKGAHIPTGGYQMTLSASGGKDLYFCNPSDVQRLSAANGNLYAVGVETLGLGIPADEMDTFTKAIPGETYAFGSGNFSTLVSTTNIYATIANGLLVGTSAAPAAGSGIYFELDTGLGIDTFTEANYSGGDRYNLLCREA